MMNYFLQTIEHLRHYEEVMLYGNLLDVTENHEQEVSDYLEKEYQLERLHYPFDAPVFEPAAAQWAGKYIYIAAQLLLYRENKPDELAALLAPYKGVITAGAILSADLLLRFLPDIIKHLKAIDPEDNLVDLLEKQLHIWHFSAVGYPLRIDELQFETIVLNPCVCQLYTDRVVAQKDLRLATHPALQKNVLASLGLHVPTYWNDFQIQLTAENGNC